MTAKPNIRDMSLDEIEALIQSLGKEKYRARQIMKGLYAGGATTFAEMTTLARDFRAKMEELTRIAEPAIDRIQTAQDGTKKVCFRVEGDLFVESVLIPGRNHWTACISTQAGCAMGCGFCLTGRQGLKRNLLPSEITGQMTMLRRHTPEGPEIKNIVLMGMGEPLANYDNVLKAIRILTSDYGLGFSSRKVTLSTCGLAPAIVRLGKDVCVNLAISLNAPDDLRRDELMPVNRKYPLAELLRACRDYPMPGRRMLTFEYILMAGVNDSPGRCRQTGPAAQGAPLQTEPHRLQRVPGISLPDAGPGDGFGVSAGPARPPLHRHPPGEPRPGHPRRLRPVERRGRSR